MGNAYAASIGATVGTLGDFQDHFDLSSFSIYKIIACTVLVKLSSKFPSGNW